MSPQAAAVFSSVQSHRVSLVESDNSFLASLIEAADEAYQKTSDEFASSAAAQVHAGPGRLTTATTTGGGRPRFNLRKRKAVAVSVNTGTSCAGGLSAVNSDFLSGLFADLQQTATTTANSTTANHDAYDDEEHYVTDGESCPGTPVPSPKKRARLGRSLSRCTKSYASLSALASATYNSTDSYVGEKFSDQTDMAPSAGAGAAQGEPTDDSEPTAAPTVSAATSTTSTTSATSTVASDVLADSLSAAAALADAIFPHLPATVSESPLRKTSSSSSSSDNSHNSADLTAQPASSTEASTTTEAGATTLHHVEPEKELTLEEVFANEEGPASAAAAVAVTPTDEDVAATGDGGGDSYGWFLALDRDVDASEEHITDAYHAAGNESSSAALAFQAPVSAAAGCAAHDAEVEWAKAADTVDDVLGDLPF